MKTTIKIVQGQVIYIAPSDFGWYVEMSNGYCSGYYPNKRTALEQANFIAREIRAGHW